MASENRKAEVKIVPLTAREQLSRIQGALARHAFLEVHFEPGHETESWEHAESQFVKKLTCGLLVQDENIICETDIAEFIEGTLELWVSQRQVTVKGEVKSSVIGPTSFSEHAVFRTLTLPADVEPAKISTRRNGSILEICFPKVCKERSRAAA